MDKLPDIYKYRNMLRAAEQELPAAREMIARDWGFNTFAEIEAAALKEETDNTPRYLQRARNAMAELRTKLFNAEAETERAEKQEQERQEAVAKLESLTSLLADQENILANLTARRSQAESAILHYCVRPPKCPMDQSHRQGALDTLLELPVLEKALPKAVITLKAEIATLRERIRSLS